MDAPILGIHHVTAIAGDPQRNLDFYEGILGLRLVKKTVNFDDPTTYHLYYGDEVGHPGTILTFFPWPGAFPGRAGAGQTSSVAFAVPKEALDFWIDRLSQFQIAYQGPSDRFGNQVLTFADPDGMQIELAAYEFKSMTEPWKNGAIASEHAIQGVHSVTVIERQIAKTQPLLDAMGFLRIAQDGNRSRYHIGAEPFGAWLDILEDPNAPSAGQGAGTIHHIAWRVADDAAQLEWQEGLSKMGLGVSAVMDREYFHSIYFREPGGVLFEIATDQPGFTVDELRESLGTDLKLPSQYEIYRAQIEQALPPLQSRDFQEVTV